MAAQKKLLAADSNLLFDLAEKKDFTLAFLEVAHERGFRLQLPPTVVQELAYAALHKSSVTLDPIPRRQFRITNSETRPRSGRTA